MLRYYCSRHQKVMVLVEGGRARDKRSTYHIVEVVVSFVYRIGMEEKDEGREDTISAPT